jgi:hypothetical protein
MEADWIAIGIVADVNHRASFSQSERSERAQRDPDARLTIAALLILIRWLASAATARAVDTREQATACTTQPLALLKQLASHSSLDYENA